VCQSTTIATGQKGVFGLAIDATSVYWATDVPNMSPTFTTDSAVMKAPVAGGAPVLVGKAPDGRGYDLAVDATNVYLEFQWNDFVQEGEVHRVPLGGGAQTGVTGWQMNPRGMVLGTGYLYFGQEQGGKMQGVSITGAADLKFGAPGRVFGTVHHGLAVDAASVYTTNDNGTTAGEILKWSVAGGVSTVLVGGQDRPSYIAADATNLYWTNRGLMAGHTGSVMKMAKAGGAVTTLASGLGGPNRIVVDASNVYWNDDVDGVIMKVPIAGGASTVLATGQMGANGLAASATHVYWTSSIALTVMKAVK
jgi:hypothetical protein